MLNMSTAKAAIVNLRPYGVPRMVLAMTLLGGLVLGAVVSIAFMSGKTACELREDMLARAGVDMGQPGRVPPSQVYKDSPIYEPPPLVDDTAGMRCQVLAARASGEVTDTMKSSAIAKDNKSIVTVTLTTKTKEGKQRTFGGDTYLGYMYRFADRHGGGIFNDEKFEVYASGIDNCDGTYTFTFDLQYVPSGKYSFAIIILSRGYMHEVSPMAPPKCGATLFGHWLSPAVLAKEGVFETNKVYFPSLHVFRGLPHALVTRYLPACNFTHPSSGRWVDHSVCMGGEHPCRDGPSYLRVADRYIWAPYACHLRYIDSGRFAAKLLENGIKTVAFLGDSRSYNVYLALNDFMRGVVANPKTGIAPTSDLARSELGVHYQEKTKRAGERVEHLVFNSHNISFVMVENYGTQPQFETFPCSSSEVPDMVTQANYLRLRKSMGIFFDNLEDLHSSSIDPDLLIVQDGGLHELFASVTDAQFQESLVKMVTELKKKYWNKRVVVMTMPATYVQDIGQMYAVRSYARQYRRVKQSAEHFRKNGFEVWDVFPMTFTRGDRYYDFAHFYPQYWYAHKAQDYPKLLPDELIQDLINRLYTW